MRLGPSLREGREFQVFQSPPDTGSQNLNLEMWYRAESAPREVLLVE